MAPVLHVHIIQPSNLDIPHQFTSILALLCKLDLFILLLSLRQMSQHSILLHKGFPAVKFNPQHLFGCLQLTADNEQLRRQLSDVQSAAEARERELQQEVQRHSSKVAELEDRIAEVMTETIGHRVP